MNKDSITKYRWQNEELEISPTIIRKFIATSSNVSDQEVKDFMDLCIYQHLNPYLKEAYLVKYGTEKANIITSKDVFDKRAFRDPKYDGEEITNNYKCGMNLMELWVRTKIYHKGMSHPASDVTVYYSEYVGKKKDGSITKIWMTKPVTMLTKVSKAQAKREANPEDLARLYLSEEFDQESKPTEKVIKEIIDDVPEEKEEESNKDEESVMDAELEDEMDERQDIYIKAILINNILNEDEKEKLRKALEKDRTSKFADEVIAKYEKIKPRREVIHSIIENKKKLFIPDGMINKWAGITNIGELDTLSVKDLEDILVKVKGYPKDILTKE